MTEATRTEPARVVPEKLLKAEDIAELLSISRTAAYRLLRDGALPSVRFGGGTVRVRPADLAAFIQAHLGGGES